MPRVIHPTWKRDYARKAARLNAETSDKAVAHRLGVSINTLCNWRWQDRKRLQDGVAR